MMNLIHLILFEIKVFKKVVLLLGLSVGCFFFQTHLVAQSFDLVTIKSVVSGNDTNNTLFEAFSPTKSDLKYIRAQRVEGPQDGVFTKNKDNIRYTSNSIDAGIPNNLSKIRFSFLKADKQTPISLKGIRVIINDIDGPNNEALATNCNPNLQYSATASITNLSIDNNPPTLNVIGTVDEKDGYTSRIMYQFVDVEFIEFENYANKGYLKDFDLNNNDFPISVIQKIKCKENNLQTNSVVLTSIMNDLNSEIVFKNEQFLINVNPIYFKLDKYFITEEAMLELEKVVATLRKYPTMNIKINAHTDSRANDDYNLLLSTKRAEAAQNWILNKGISKNRLSYQGFGETQLTNKCSNGETCTEEEHQQNRRVEFVIQNPKAIDFLTVQKKF